MNGSEADITKLVKEVEQIENHADNEKLDHLNVSSVLFLCVVLVIRLVHTVKCAWPKTRHGTVLHPCCYTLLLHSCYYISVRYAWPKNVDMALSRTPIL